MSSRQQSIITRRQNIMHAARHHKEAAKHLSKHETAAHHAHLAHGHLQHATHHAGEAAKAHIQDHGNKACAANA